ncbi:MAG: AMP-binding protein [Bosea sp. (in: a-proteobacteria)]|uniref:AMP-binding protein n=1 Tax=Bosea sp. (in: a-proteobacteria) TaxID=1871050 RepID=UPI00273434E6|nr:AMP-binding protein [Bosea sp. (in: a-proteobacteria)]MDP3600559.1 AMP-binding protein [Bosea sp. (in: a-proteobacteria)]
MINLSSFIDFHASRTPERLAIVFNEARITYATLASRVATTAGWLKEHGIGEGDVVAVLMKNSAAFVEIAIAVGHIGAVFLPINFRLSADEVGYIVENAGAKLLIADEELADSAALGGAVILLDSVGQSDSTRLGPEAAPAARVPRKPGDLFRLMYTSGTTDRPKGVMHSYENFYWKCSDHIVALGLNAESRLLVTGPLYHVGAFDLPGLAVLWVGGMLCIIRDFSAETALAAIAREELDSAWLAPVMTSAMLATAPTSGLDLTSLRWVIGGGERTPEARIRSFCESFPRARYIDAYGLTETCSGDTLMEAGREIEKIGSVGRALAHVEIEIRDEQGRALPAGETGEICLRGPKITLGYWNDPAKTEAAFYDDWFRSGDMGYLDRDGFLFLTDRLKDMIISGGENIASSEVERVIFELPQVREVAVIGAPDERWGEKPVAFVVLEPGEELSLEALRSHCRTKLAAFKAPRDIVIRESLPRNPSGKILKRLLREEFRS